MKTLIIFLCTVFISMNLSGQSKMNEQKAMKESHIDFTKEYIFFTIHGLIEVDGHTFQNDTRKCPIQFQANLDGITIIDTCLKVKYEHRVCEVKDCKVIHLVESLSLQLLRGWAKPNYILTPNSNYLNLHGDTLHQEF